MKQVAHRGILQAVLEERRRRRKGERLDKSKEESGDGEVVFPGRVRGIKCANIEDYAKEVARTLEGRQLLRNGLSAREKEIILVVQYFINVNVKY